MKVVWEAIKAHNGDSSVKGSLVKSISSNVLFTNMGHISHSHVKTRQGSPP